MTKIYKNRVILLMEEILPQLLGSFSHYLQGFVHPRWCRISSINSITGCLVPFIITRPTNQVSVQDCSSAQSSCSLRATKSSIVSTKNRKISRCYQLRIENTTYSLNIRYYKYLQVYHLLPSWVVDGQRSAHKKNTGVLSWDVYLNY